MIVINVFGIQLGIYSDKLHKDFISILAPGIKSYQYWKNIENIQCSYAIISQRGGNSKFDHIMAEIFSI
jgi:hypothetical protein